MVQTQKFLMQSGTNTGTDILVTCAGISEFLSLEETSDEVWDNNLAVNLTAVFRLVRDANVTVEGSLPTGCHHRFGHVGIWSPGLNGIYRIEHGLLGLSRALATELGVRHYCKLCSVCAIETLMTATALNDMPEYKTFWSEKRHWADSANRRI